MLQEWPVFQKIAPSLYVLLFKNVWFEVHTKNCSKAFWTSPCDDIVHNSSLPFTAGSNIQRIEKSLQRLSWGSYLTQRHKFQKAKFTHSSKSVYISIFHWQKKYSLLFFLHFAIMKIKKSTRNSLINKLSRFQHF